MKYYNGGITTLTQNEIFVFGCNEVGFHGAGAAGFATFGESGNVWRNHNYADKPRGWKGKWTQKGFTGFQTGTEGSSYGIITIERPGDKRSKTVQELTKEVEMLYATANELPNHTFYVAQAAKTGLNGHTPEVMAWVYAEAGPIPANLSFQVKFYNILTTALFRS